MTFISSQSNSLTRTTIDSIQKNGQKAQKSIEKLSTGKRLNRAGDDVASMSISAKLDTDIRGIDQAQKNIMDAMGHMEVAEGGLLQSLENVQRIRELMVQGLNGTNSVEEKNMLQREINAIVEAQIFLANETRLNMYIEPNASSVFSGGYDKIPNHNFTIFADEPFQWNGINYQIGREQDDLININFKDYSEGQLSVSPGQFFVTGPDTPILKIDLLHLKYLGQL
ncbi:MAG: flagellin [Candidatus Caenarcaniphilales bacterium]|nr:flagellin [Candidatus Caenarcaniphilales bacterium]